EGTKSTILLGNQAIWHADGSSLEVLASALAEVTGAKLGYLTDGANSAGASIAGVLPHCSVGGVKAGKTGLNASQMLANSLNTYVLMGVEPEFDTADPKRSLQSLKDASFVVSLSAFSSDSLKEYADVILPVAASVETAGTFVNAAGDWQSFNGCVPPKGEARPAWKVLRVLGNLFEADGFDYMSAEDILDEIQSKTKDLSANTPTIHYELKKNIKSQAALVSTGGVAMYGGDAIVRRAPALQATHDAIKSSQVGLSERTASKFNLSNGDSVLIKQAGVSALAEVRIDSGLAENCVAIPAGTELSAKLSAQGSEISLEKTTQTSENTDDMVRATHA
ncbi:MAG: molybdopterin-dependent oxidoreductase, partial [Robiginitomaculum sp.]|nr:molybdopterin-dependent oxidoreductase [Robiginitomaculum sp.]